MVTDTSTARTPVSSAASVEVVTDSARLAELGDQWTALWARCPGAGLFQSFEYCLDAWEVVERPSGNGLACLVGWSGDRLVAVWPFVTFRNRLWTHARPLMASSVELHELLVDEQVDATAWTRQAWQALRTQAGVDVVDTSFSEDSATAPALRSLPARAVERGGVACVRVALRSEESWDAFYGSLSKSSRKDAAKARRRLEELGPVELSVLEAGDARTGALVDWTLTQKRVWAEQSGKRGHWLYSDRYRQFLETQLARPDGSARNVVLTLTVGGELVAAQIGALSKERFDAVIAGFDPAYKRFSPGARLTEVMIRWAWEQGVDCELGAGTEPYKTFWSRGQEVPIATHRSAVSPWGVVGLGVRRAARRVAGWRPAARRSADRS